MISVSYAAESIILAEYSQNHFAKVSFVKRQQIKVSDVLKAITDYKPIFGHRTTIKNQTIWMAFMK